MPEREVLEHVHCPKCDSPLASIDWDTDDEHARKNAAVRVRGGFKWVAALWVFAFVTVVYEAFFATRDEALWERVFWAVVIFIGFAALSAITALALDLRKHLNTEDAGGQAPCLACRHEWWVP